MTPAFQRSLEVLFDEERRRFGKRLAWLHVTAGALGLAVSVYALVTQGWYAVGPTVIVAAAFATVGFVMFGLSRSERLLPYLGWALPVIDMPMIIVAQYFQFLRLKELMGSAPWQSLTTVISVSLALSVASVLSLSRRIVIATLLLAAANIVTRDVMLGIDNAALGITLVAIFGLGFGLISYVGRVYALIASSRQNDLLGKYVLGRRVGAGGMAEVFEATYCPEGGFERRVAVKRILPAYAEDTATVALFRREAEVGAQLAHPNVVQVLDFGSVGNTFFLAMELIDGVPLNLLLDGLRAANTRFPLRAAAHLAWQLAEALDYVHERVSPTGAALHLVHRDLNPPNVMITRIGDVKLTDFGIARAATHQSMTAAGVLRGKLAYSAPEQLRGQQYDARADLFALGVTLHEVLTGSRLFAAPNDVDVLRSVLEGEIAPPSKTRPEVPAELDAVVMGLLERDPEKRTGRASDLRRQLLALPPTLLSFSEGKQELSALARRPVTERPEAATPMRASASDATREVVRT